MRRRIVPLILSLAFLGVTWMVAAASGPTHFDLFVLQAVANFRSPALTTAMMYLTELGRTPVALIASVAAWRRSRVLAIHLAAATIGGWLITEAVKRVIERPRPAIIPLVSASGYSFPSGHSLVAAATYTTVAIMACRELQNPGHRMLVATVTIILVGIVAVSRVYLGVHYVSDAIGGLLLGTAWAATLALVFPTNQKKARV